MIHIFKIIFNENHIKFEINKINILIILIFMK